MNENDDEKEEEEEKLIHNKVSLFLTIKIISMVSSLFFLIFVVFRKCNNISYLKQI